MRLISRSISVGLHKLQIAGECQCSRYDWLVQMMYTYTIKKQKINKVTHTMCKDDVSHILISQERKRFRFQYREKTKCFHFVAFLMAL